MSTGAALGSARQTGFAMRSATWEGFGSPGCV